MKITTSKTIKEDFGTFSVHFEYEDEKFVNLFLIKKYEYVGDVYMLVSRKEIKDFKKALKFLLDHEELNK